VRIAVERDDQVGPGRIGGEVDVGLRRLGGTARVRVVGRDLPALVIEIVGRAQRLEAELEAVWRVALVDRAVDLVDDATLGARIAAALVRRLLARVRNQRVPVSPGHPHASSVRD
jgi:hypothetical protein